MELSDGIGYLLRLTYLADFCIMDKNINIKLIESERNLPSGSIVRQLLRLCEFMVITYHLFIVLSKYIGYI